MRLFPLGCVLAGLLVTHDAWITPAWANPKVAPKGKPGRRSIAAKGTTAHASTRSPCGRHFLVLRPGAVLLDGQRVHSPAERFEVAGTPLWRPDGLAVAWLERTPTGLRLVVIADVEQSPSPLFWSLPGHTMGQQLAWAGPHRVVVGADLLAPQAAVSWTEDS